jgi:hypothetical protein
MFARNCQCIIAAIIHSTMKHTSRTWLLEVTLHKHQSIHPLAIDVRIRISILTFHVSEEKDADNVYTFDFRRLQARQAGGRCGGLGSLVKLAPRLFDI